MLRDEGSVGVFVACFDGFGGFRAAAGAWWTGLGRQAQWQGQVVGTGEPDADRNYARRELFFSFPSILS
jgi:hypothetical protein